MCPRLPARDKEPSEGCQNHVRHPKYLIPLIVHHPTDSRFDEVVQYENVGDGIELSM